MHGGAASKSTRTFGDFESVADAMKGISQLYEQRLMQMNPGQGQAPAPFRAAPAAFGAADTGIRRYFTAGTMACNNSKGACKGLQTRLSDKQSAAPNPINPPHHVIPCTPPPCLFCDSAAHVGWSVAHSLILVLQGPDDRALAPGPGGISSPLHRLVKHVAHVLQRALSRVLSARQHLDDGGDASVFAREQSLSQAQTIRHASQTFTTVLKILRRAQGRQLNRVRALFAHSHLLGHAFQMRENAVLDPLLVVRLVRAVSVVHEAAQIAKLVDEGVQLCDVICDIPHAWPRLQASGHQAR